MKRKLTDRQVAEIRLWGEERAEALRPFGTLKQKAADYGVSHSTVCNILRNPKFRATDPKLAERVRMDRPLPRDFVVVAKR